MFDAALEYFMRITSACFDCREQSSTDKSCKRIARYESFAIYSDVFEEKTGTAASTTLFFVPSVLRVGRKKIICKHLLQNHSTVVFSIPCLQFISRIITIAILENMSFKKLFKFINDKTKIRF